MKQNEVPKIQRIEEELENILRENNSKKIFVVSGKTSFEKSGAKNKLSQILKNNQHIIFDEFSPNPKADDVIKGIKVFEEFNPDIVLAIGGGSAMDVAKSIYGFSNTNVDPNKYFRESQSNLEIKTQTPFVAVPTTAGTGSEATHFAVIYVDGKKYSFADQKLRPSHYILDVELTMRLSSKITANTALDAFSQSLESFWASKANKESQEYSREALNLLIPNIRDVVNNPNIENRSAVLMGAHLAGKAINLSTTTAPHAFSYDITSFYGIDHGHAVCLTLPEIAKYNAEFENKEINHPGGKEALENIFSEIYSIMNVNSSEGLKNSIYSLVSDLNLENSLKKIMGENDKIQEIIDGVNMQRLGNNPVSIKKEDAEEIFRNIK